MHLSLLLSDYLIYTLVIALVVMAIYFRHNPNWLDPWRQVLMTPWGGISAVILGFYALIGLLDSIHFQVMSPQQGIELRSVLDLLMSPLDQRSEQTYSAPFANHLFVQSIIETADGHQTRGYPHLQYTNGNVADILQRTIKAIIGGTLSFLIIFFLLLWLYCIHNYRSFTQTWRKIFFGQTTLAWREIFSTFIIMWLIVWVCALLSQHYHLLGTDKVGRDVFYLSVKSIRTGLIIGTLTTLFTLPFALFLGTIAGYFRGWIDDVIQYAYTTLSSIPDVLLISASVLMLQVYMAKHAANYPSLAVRADVRLLALCFILAITGWATLCRFLRGETLKLRELDFVQAAQALGVKPYFNHFTPYYPQRIPYCAYNVGTGFQYLSFSRGGFNLCWSGCRSDHHELGEYD